MNQGTLYFPIFYALNFEENTSFLEITPIWSLVTGIV